MDNQDAVALDSSLSVDWFERSQYATRSRVVRSDKWLTLETSASLSFLRQKFDLHQLDSIICHMGDTWVLLFVTWVTHGFYNLSHE